jgi:hypothetical protein
LHKISTGRASPYIRYSLRTEKPQIFVSCGQRTPEEKELGEALCQAIRDHGGFDCFFAESQHNLKGLHENILDALAKASGFITVLHRRGNVGFESNGAIALVRASVWIEQEIAIAAFIQRTSKNDLLTATYLEEGVGREGLRDLLHLNPTVFSNNSDVIKDFKAKLDAWCPQSISEDDQGKLELKCERGYESGIQVMHLTPVLTNKARRVKEYSCTLDIPGALLTFNSASHVIEVQRSRPGYRRFRVTEEPKQHAVVS